MYSEAVDTYTVRVYMAGDIETAKRHLRHECWAGPLCVTVDSTTFIYTGGEEQGFVVGFVNYPRFPDEPARIWNRAAGIACDLITACAQKSALVVAPDRTEWFHRKASR